MSTTTKREPLDALEAYFAIGRHARPLGAVVEHFENTRLNDLVGDVAALADRALKDLIELEQGRKIEPGVSARLTEVATTLSAISALALVLDNFKTLTNCGTSAPLMERGEYEGALLGLATRFARQYRDSYDAVEAWTAACGPALEVAP